MDKSFNNNLHNHNFTLYGFLPDEDFLWDNIFYMGGCTEECRQNYIKALEELSDAIKGHISIIKSIKKNEDGTLPSIYLGDVNAFYEGTNIMNPNIQDFFNVNLLDLNLSYLKKGSFSNEKEKKENKK
ncbi:hypothetical protein DICPUDRAFT_158100 [Dictyostelium purpureum]|uniref:Uncharacterized protein n=1 Tax=Dictyostelium purpureum TaxID=5786 RepID=F1A0U4_DICPU|nr:uncharacterized protein DICPUDRAFT_158100 [Dictyostelium purpureum]EGC30181.1 hypothetical protein DICPUDRAFT_158100 [Dictyostelium purpureum]|eukprot:XP_003293288.1 hypothetical protein DICPUDRAFT_158100 [Dictyostelium purpureum]